jgi:hypothetical protein
MSDPAAADDDETNPIVKVTSLVVLGVGLTALFLGYEWFWVVFAVGFAAVVPIVKVLTETLGVGGASERERESAPRPHDRDRTPDRAENRTNEPESTQDALDTLRTRYARGELTEAEFERKVEALLETETPESARKRAERAGSSERETESLRETDR